MHTCPQRENWEHFPCGAEVAAIDSAGDRQEDALRVGMPLTAETVGRRRRMAFDEHPQACGTTTGQQGE
ncbi:MAG: hypothetical protein KDA75_09620 [Planctomycetaceae bacterium]|nr:hypothetical protein [Planctomycetaceae bacterium]